MLIARPFDRPVVIDETNFHYLAVPSVGSHAEAAARRARRAASAIPRRVPRCATRSSTTTAIRRRARRCRRRSGTRCSSTRSRSPSTRSTSRGRSARSPTSSASRPPTRCSTSRSPRISPRSSAGGPRARSGRQAVGEAQRDPRMMIGVSDGGAHLARDDGADWSSYFLRSWVLDRQVWTLEEGIRQITQVPAALVGLGDRGVLRPGAPADLMVFDPETIGPWKKEFVHDLPGGVGRFKAWGKGVQATVVNGVPIVLHGELTGRLPGQVVRPGVTQHRRPRPGCSTPTGTSSSRRACGTSSCRRSSRSTRRACSSTTATTTTRAATASASASRAAPRRWARRARRRRRRTRRSRCAAGRSRARGSTTWPSTASTRPRSIPRSAS